MAKSKSFFGLRRGSTKTMTYSVLNGAQITKDRVVGGENPRTRNQQTQRSLFANVVKFYKHSRKALFKFAFEDKRITESDYNAFVRHNVGRSLVLSKDAVDAPNFPALGKNWMLTYGTLPSPDVEYNDTAAAWRFDAPSAGETEVTSVAAISQILINDFGLQVGDIVTYVRVSSAETTSVDSRPNYPPLWSITQIRVDPNSEDTRSFAHAVNGKIIMDNGLLPAIVGAAAVIFSRPISGQPLRVSTSYLVNNTGAEELIEGVSGIAYIESALSSWGAGDEAILEGALVQ